MATSRQCPHCQRRHDAAASCLMAALADRRTSPGEQRFADLAEETGIEEYIRRTRRAG
ncbi:MAG: hypothetical protein JWM18_278 [Chloroflexi bacterium]|jgi:hypothetical protein|nr:hypothetical protein [Chloroflexota bacterium]